MPPFLRSYRGSTCLIRLACVLAFVLALQPVAGQAFTISASSVFFYRNSSFNSTVPGGSMDAALIVPGGSGEGSGLNSNGNLVGFSYSVAVAALQDYGVFRGRAFAGATRSSPGATFEVFQVFGEGIFKETLTIPAPMGVANGSTGQLMLGWDVTGTLATSINGSAALYISAHTSVPLPNSSSIVLGITGSGHYELDHAIPFIFGTPFELTVDSAVFAAVGYDYTQTTPSEQFSTVAEAGFLHTAILSTAAVSNAAGTPLPDATIITSSGRAFPVVVVPEPASLCLAIAGLALVATRSFRSQRRTAVYRSIRLLHLCSIRSSNIDNEYTMSTKCNTLEHQTMRLKWITYAMLAIAVSLPAGSVMAQESVWIGGLGAWIIPTNWQFGLVPNASRNAVINNGGTANITFTGAAQARSLTLGVGVGQSGTVGVYVGNSLTTGIDDIVVGNAGTGTFAISGGGVVDSGNGILGALANSTGTATITGAGSRWGIQAIGYIGTSRLRNVADREWSVSLLVSWVRRLRCRCHRDGDGHRTGSVWHQFNLVVGDSGAGSVRIENGGQAITNYGITLGQSAGATGDVTVTGTNSLWDAGTGVSLYVGAPVPASSRLPTAPPVWVHPYIGGTGHVTVNSQSTVNIGAGGLAGTLDTGEILNNGTLNFNHTDSITFPVPIAGSGQS